MAFNDEEDDGFGQYVATQEFIETSEAIASLYHHSLKVLIEVKDLPFVLGRDKTKASVVTHDPNLEAISRNAVECMPSLKRRKVVSKFSQKDLMELQSFAGVLL